MKIRVFAILAALFWSSFATAAVLNFDTIDADNNCVTWGGSVDGFTIGDETAGFVEDDACSFLNADGSFSPPNMMVNFNSRIGTISKDFGTFDLNGAYFHADDRDGTTTVEFAGYDATDTLIFSKTEDIAASWQWVSFDWPGIKTFTWDPISPNSTSNVSVDDMTYDGLIADPEPVPTMSEWALITLVMLLGLMVFANRRRLF